PDPKSLRVFEIHARPPAIAASTYSWFESELRSRLAPIVPAGCQLRLVLWDQMHAARMHNRFVLTNFCGISLDTGLDEVDTGTEMDDWQLLSENHSAEVWNSFRARLAAPYAPVHECNIP